jgi:hypothetical protein
VCGGGVQDNEDMINRRQKLRIARVFIACFIALLVGCEDPYGKLGGADETDVLRPGDQQFETIMSSLSGVWYSHYAGTGRLDGYRIGTWGTFDTLVKNNGKIDLFPSLGTPYKTYTTESGGTDTPAAGDYFVMYDDTVYGEGEDGSGGNGGWGDLPTRYIGIVRAINIFNNDLNRGAIIIEYLIGGAPQWLNKWPESRGGKRPFFGIYYRILDSDTVQMANAVDLAALYKGEPYYTEKEHLEDAIKFNTIKNEAEFISWGVVIPQDKEH